METFFVCLFQYRVHKYPEALPKLDFAAYKAQLPNAAMVDEFQKNVSLILCWLYLSYNDISCMYLDVYERNSESNILKKDFNYLKITSVFIKLWCGK